MRSEGELFSRFREGLTPETKKDLDKLLFLYSWFLDEPDPKRREELRSQMQLIEKKYNLEVDH